MKRTSEDGGTAKPANDGRGQLLLLGPCPPSPIEQWNDTLAKGFASGCAPNTNGREPVPRHTPTRSCTPGLAWFVSMHEASAFRGQHREPFAESWMHEMCLASSMSRK